MNSNYDWQHATNENDVENQPSTDSLITHASEPVGNGGENRYPSDFRGRKQESKLTIEQGSDEQGSDEQGSDEQGSDEQGSDEQGSDEQGSDEKGSGQSKLNCTLVVQATHLPNRKKRRSAAERAQELREVIEKLEKEAATLASKAKIAERKDWERRYFLLGKAMVGQMASLPPSQARALEVQFVALMSERDQTWYREHPHSTFENIEPDSGGTTDSDRPSAN